MGFKRPKLFSFRGGEKKREGGGEEKRKKKKMEEPISSQQGTELLTLSRDPWFCLVNGHLLYPNLGFVRISS